MSRFVRTYDANGRILEEKHILENPILLFVDKFAPLKQFNAAQLEATNTAMKLVMPGGPSAGRTYAYDVQGRVSEMRDHNRWFDKVTTISYNEHGDQTAKRSTVTPAESVVTACSMDPNGTMFPERVATEPTGSPALPRENEVLCAYEYDSYGNWTQQTENPDRPHHVYVRHRQLTYY